MARTSGRVGAGPFQESLERAAFRDGTGVEYRVSRSKQKLLVEFERPQTDVRGVRTLDWFIGSGRVGRSYIFSVDGFFYQAPVSYFTGPSEWGVSPGFQRKTSIDLTRAIEPACLQCHASQLRHVAGTQNRFEDPPFRQEGIGCERCHGPGGAHAERMRNGRSSSRTATGAGIINPGKLAADRRDSICAQCHLTGAARVARSAAKTQSYRPGDRIADHLAVFVWSDAQASGLTVTSHYEKLAHSRCKKASADKMWCVTCHDPHGEPKPASRIAHYRERCLNCHQSRGCTERAAVRKEAGDDCTSCHMPKGATADSEHMVYTDHSIPRRREGKQVSTIEARQLVSFWSTPPNARDLALGYAVAAMTEPAVRQQAFDLLKAAAQKAPNDAAVVMQLAQFHDRMRQPDQAATLYDRVIQLDSTNAVALINRGALHAQSGQVEDAMRLWQQALRLNPGFTQARLNLAVAQFRARDRRSAMESVRQALLYDPDHEAARKMLIELGH